MRVEVHADYTTILLDTEEVKEICRPGAGADTCVWLAAGTEGFECLYYDRRGINLVGETLEERWQKGLTVAKRNGCEIIKALNVQEIETIDIDGWDVEAWAARSRMGEVCGIYGCPNTPVATCPHCGNNYCEEHRFVINTPGHS